MEIFSAQEVDLQEPKLFPEESSKKLVGQVHVKSRAASYPQRDFKLTNEHAVNMTRGVRLAKLS